MQGRRVEGGFQGLKEIGDYSPFYQDGKLAGIWMILPNSDWGRLPNIGFGQEREGGKEPEWTITENSDGTITVDPSIQQRGSPNGDWHGFLRAGVWSDA